MKKVLYAASLLLAGIMVACEEDEIGVSGGVYVCTGKGATVWHCRRDCAALSNCNGQVILTSTPGSQYKKPCKKCYK